MNLFPYIITRISGFPVDNFEELNINVTKASFKYIYKLKLELQELSNTICEQLFKHIGAIEIESDKSYLINLRRNIYNLRPVSKEYLALLLENTQLTNIIGLVKKYHDLNTELDQEIKAAKRGYELEIDECRRNLKELILDDSFQKGLVLSSSVLLKTLKTYANTPVEKFRKKDLQTERGLIKYLSRMTFKTSPYSTFTNLSITNYQKNSFESGQVTRPPRVESHIRINNKIFHCLKNLVFHIPDFYKKFQVRLNPTINERENSYHFLINVNNIESFQQLEANPFLNIIIHLVGDVNLKFTFGSLINKIIEFDILDTTEQELIEYLRQIIKIGLLEFDLEISEIDTEWDSKFYDLLLQNSVDDPIDIKFLLNFLSDLNQKSIQFSKGNADERVDILSSAFEQFQQVFIQLYLKTDFPEENIESLLNSISVNARKQSLNNAKDQNPVITTDDTLIDFKIHHTPFFSFTKENIFYEDTSSTFNPNYQELELNGIANKVDQLLLELDIFDLALDERIKIKEYFKDKYPNHQEVSVVQFYEDYYRDFKKNLDREEFYSNNEDPSIPNESEYLFNHIRIKVKDLNNLRKNWLETFSSEFINENLKSDQIDLSLQDIKSINERLKITTDDKRSSRGIFFQVFSFGKDYAPNLIGMVNGACPGYGKFFGRFLHIFSEEITYSIKASNLESVSGAVAMEIQDSSNFNGNLHPPLTNKQIRIPGCHNNVPVEEQTNLKDIYIFYSKENDKLKLCSRDTKEEIVPLDLGFESLKSRSKLFRLLDKFSPIKYTFFHPLLKEINRKIFENSSTGDINPSVIIYPRVLFEGNVVLQRKRWHILKSVMPVLSNKETEGEYFVRLNIWRKTYNIPEEIFIVIKEPSFQKISSKSSQVKNNKGPGRDDYKPQYINFNNPFLVNLFNKLIEKTSEEIRIEEMLPNSKNLNKINGKRFVTENLMQWY